VPLVGNKEQRTTSQNPQQHVLCHSVLLLSSSSLDSIHSIADLLPFPLPTRVLLILGSVPNDIDNGVDPARVRAEVGVGRGIVVSEDVEAVCGGGNEREGELRARREEGEEEREKGEGVDGGEGFVRSFAEIERERIYQL
jgi:hypothetical protein